jgi:hypothetical protein
LFGERRALRVVLKAYYDSIPAWAKERIAKAGELQLLRWLQQLKFSGGAMPLWQCLALVSAEPGASNSKE